MAITDVFKSAVAAGDVRGIRIMMKDSLLVDPTFSEFNEMDNLAKGVGGLYEAHDGRDLNKDTSAWNDDYMNKLMVQVVGNFSHDRVNHLKKVVQFLRPVTERPRQTASDTRIETEPTPPSQTAPAQRISYQKQKYRDQRHGRIIVTRSQKIAAGAVVGGVVGGIIVSGGSVTIGAVVGAAAVGAAVFAATNGEY